MSDKYTSLSNRISDELADLQVVLEKCARAWELAQQEPNEQDLFVDSVALNLHNIYSGLESLFELIARHVDGNMPGGSDWHRQLLVQMQTDVPEVRPAVISPASRELLDEYRRFRHLVRNVYTVNLHPDRMGKLVRQLNVLWSCIKPELEAFAQFLKDESNK